MNLADIREAITKTGLSYRGAFNPAASDPVGTLVLAGFVGNRNWPAFATSAEFADGKPDPLDRWSLRIITDLAAKLGAAALFPFGDPPFLPFQRWAQKAEPVAPSPLGILIHPDWGLWHSYRGALGFRERLVLPMPDIRPRPCDSCLEKPCLTACPVSAFGPAGYVVSACVGHIASPAGADCMDLGCRARRACPVGAEHRYGPDQAHFHLSAFRAAQSA